MQENNRRQRRKRVLTAIVGEVKQTQAFFSERSHIRVVWQPSPRHAAEVQGALRLGSKRGFDAARTQ
jgi:hypothetical protein